MSLLDIESLAVTLHSEDSSFDLVKELSVSISQGETLCIVGESGSGKTVTALSIIRLLEFAAPVELHGRMLFAGRDLATLSERSMRQYRGKRISMIFQEALESLNPSKRIEDQLIEAFAEKSGISKRFSKHASVKTQARERAVALLKEVGLADTERILRLYPHQISGGMQQRVMIALALMSDPDLLLADEPTTALDVTTQAEILTLLKTLQTRRKMATIFITHDMGVASQVADRIAVMYGGRLIEVGSKDEILTRPKHHYTKALLACVPKPSERFLRKLPSIPGSVPDPSDEFPGCRFAPRCPAATEICRTQTPALESKGPNDAACWHPLSAQSSIKTTEAPATSSREINRSEWAVVTKGITKVFTSRTALGAKRTHTAVKELDLQIAHGEFFGLVGESGSGKTTLGRMIAGLERPTSGVASFSSGNEINTKGVRGDAKKFRSSTQIVFQDPRASLDPRWTIGRIIAEPLLALSPLRGKALDGRVRELLDQVGLPFSFRDKRAADISGGQRQRVAIARAIAPKPSLIVADEPTSALDVSVQGQVMNLLLELQENLGLSFLFITHNLSLVLSVADRLGVMYQGELIQTGTPNELTGDNAHEYTERLLSANPDLSKALA